MPKSSDGNVHALTDRDIQLSARLMIVEYGDTAEAKATKRVVQMEEIGDAPAAAAWAEIRNAVRALSGTDTD